MKLKWEQPGGIDHELIWGIIGLLALTSAVLLPADRLLEGAGFRCSFHALTGLPCPTCRATRAFVAAGSLQMGRALELNPLGAVSFIALCFYVPFALASVLLSAPRARLREVSRRQKRYVFLLGGFLVLGNWAYLIATNTVYP